MANLSPPKEPLQPKARGWANAFDAPDGYSGQEYDLTRERAEGAKLPSGTVDPKAKGKRGHQQASEIPPDNGRRASFDPASGEVHGSGLTDGKGDGREGFSEDS
jgi:hypothetical protein